MAENAIEIDQYGSILRQDGGKFILTELQHAGWHGSQNGGRPWFARNQRHLTHHVATAESGDCLSLDPGLPIWNRDQGQAVLDDEQAVSRLMRMADDFTRPKIPWPHPPSDCIQLRRCEPLEEGSTSQSHEL